MLPGLALDNPAAINRKPATGLECVISRRAAINNPTRHDGKVDPTKTQKSVSFLFRIPCTLDAGHSLRISSQCTQAMPQTRPDQTRPTRTHGLGRHVQHSSILMSMSCGGIRTVCTSTRAVLEHCFGSHRYVPPHAVVSSQTYRLQNRAPHSPHASLVPLIHWSEVEAVGTATSSTLTGV